MKNRRNSPTKFAAKKESVSSILPFGLNHCLYVFLALGICAAVIYSNALNNPFVWDDETLREETCIRQLWPPWNALWAPKDISLSGRPILSYSFAIGFAIHGDSAIWSRVVNLLLHVCCGWLATISFGKVLEVVFPRQSVLERFTQSLATGLLWISHPLNSEVINYITQRSEILFGIFYLLCVFGAIIAWGHPRLGVTLSVLSAWLGAFTKESMISVIAVVIVYDYLCTSESLLEIWRKRRVLYAGIVSSWVPILSIMSTGPRTQSVGFGLGITGFEYLLTQGWVLGRYLWQTVLPFSLLLDYGEEARLAVSDWLPGGVAVTIVVIFTAVALFKRNILGLVGCWCFIVLAPTSSIIPIRTEVGAERRMYLPLIALVGLLVIVLSKGIDRFSFGSERQKRWIFGIAFVGLFGSWCNLTIERNLDYRTSVGIWSDSAKKLPDNARAFINLAHALIEEQRMTEAVDAGYIAVMLRPNWPNCWHNFAVALSKIDKNKALETSLQVLQRNPRSPRALALCGLSLREAGRPNEARESMLQSLSIEPRDAAGWNLLGMIERDLGNVAQAEKCFRTAIEIDPEFAEPYANVGAIQRDLDSETATAFLEKALILYPDEVSALVNLGILRARSGDHRNARMLFLRALELSPENEAAKKSLEGLDDVVRKAVD